MPRAPFPAAMDDGSGATIWHAGGSLKWGGLPFEDLPLFRRLLLTSNHHKIIHIHFRHISFFAS